MTVQPCLIISSDTPSADITDFESDFADQVALSWDVQDLRFHNARTANTFTDEPVSDEPVKAIDDLAKWAPTSMNDQPLRIVRVRSPAARDWLVQTMGDGNKAKTAAAALVAILAADHDFRDGFPKTFPYVPAARDMFAADDALRASDPLCSKLGR